MWLLSVSTNKTASAVLKARLGFERANKKQSRAARGRTEYFTAYQQVVDFFLKKCATNKAITETESKIARLAQP